MATPRRQFLHMLLSAAGGLAAVSILRKTEVVFGEGSLEPDPVFNLQALMGRAKKAAANSGDETLVNAIQQPDACPFDVQRELSTRSVAQQQAFMSDFFSVFPNAPVLADYGLLLNNFATGYCSYIVDPVPATRAFVGDESTLVTVRPVAEATAPLPALTTLIPRDDAKDVINADVGAARSGAMRASLFIATLAVAPVAEVITGQVDSVPVGEALRERVLQVSIGAMQRGIFSDVYAGADRFRHLLELLASGFLPLGPTDEGFLLARLN